MGNIVFNSFYKENESLTIQNYRDYSMGIFEVPFIFEENISNNLEVSNIFLEKRFKASEISNKYLCFHGVSYACNIFIDGKLINYHEGVWSKFSVFIDEIKTEYADLVIEIIRPNFDKDSDFNFRKILFGFIPDISMPFTGIFRDIEILDDTSFFELSYTIRNNQVIFDSEIDKIEIFFENKECNLLKDGHNVTVYDVKYWTPTMPKIYIMKVYKNEKVREFEISFTNFKIDNNKMKFGSNTYYMKGILHWGYYPETIVPNLTYEEAEKEILKIKALGFNTIKLCLFFPQEIYYQLCQKHGMVIWQEYPLWLPTSDKIVENRLLNEITDYNNIVSRYSNIPFITIGCELDGTMDTGFVNNIYNITKEKFIDRYVCDNSGSNECFAGTDIIETDFYDYHFYGELAELKYLVEQFAQDYRSDKPWVFGEFNDSDSWRKIDFEDDAWWKSGDQTRNLMLKSHEGFESGTNLTIQPELIKDIKNHDVITKNSIIKSYQYRKEVLEILRLNSKIQGYNITTLRDVAITTSGIFDDNMNCKYKEEDFKNLLADYQVLLLPSLRRKWINGGDIFEKKDMYNAFIGEDIPLKVLVSNLIEIDKFVNIKIFLNDKKIYEKNMNTPYFINSINDISIECNKVGKNIIRTILEVEERNFENTYEFMGFTKKNNDVVIFDKSYKLDIEGARVDNLDSLYNKIIVTDTLKLEKWNELKKDNIIIYVMNNDEFFKLTNGPMWRESVFTQNKEFEAIDISNPLHLNCVSGKKFVHKEEIISKIGNYTQILTRLDARKFYTSEYIFYKDNTYFISLDFKDTEKENILKFDKKVLIEAIINEMVEKNGKI